MASLIVLEFGTYLVYRPPLTIIKKTRIEFIQHDNYSTEYYEKKAKHTKNFNGARKLNKCLEFCWIFSNNQNFADIFTF
jgi:hypothetical protein